jgi:uncharacterized protein (DUF362 family)/NAD-dependent dihydropyrimidine dehydrogenase PreA subunit
MVKVAIVKCTSYDEEIVYKSVKRGIDLLGGMGSLVKKNEKILLKVNNLVGSKPDDAVTTHPSILNAMIRILINEKVKVIYGDSPGFEKPAAAIGKSGYDKIAEKYNITMGDFDTGKIVDFPEGVVCKKFSIANACLDADGIISLPKMKAHQLTRITGAVKNQFGCVNGLNKAGFHVRYPNPTDFSRMLVDLNLLLKPRLYVMDGIIAMEGNGPRGGDPVKMNCLIISNDPIAVDATFCRLIGLDPLFVPTIKYGQLEGLGSYEYITYVGDPIDEFINKKFNVVRKPVKNSSFKSLMPSIIRNAIYSRPIINKAKCIKCGICVNACPVEGKALNFKERKNPPVYNYGKCIRCFCCQEMCPQKAIYVERPWLGKIVFRKN